MKRKQPEALRLAEWIEDDMSCDGDAEIAAELRRLHAENVTLQHGYDAARMEIEGLRDRVQELGAMLRENCNRRIVELEAQLEAIGAGGVEPLRRRECLHKISEPGVAPEHALKDVRCGRCGYMTYHREHIGCIRAAAPATQAQAGAVPLTDEQIQEAILPINPHGMGYFLRIARAIERAHGIGIKDGDKS